MSYSLTEQSQNDIDLILEYSYQVWGKDQTRKYLQSLFNSFDLLSENPYLGSSADYICNDLRKWPINSHLILYIINETSITILRILHKNMDTENQFLF